MSTKKRPPRDQTWPTKPHIALELARLFGHEPRDKTTGFDLDPCAEDTTTKGDFYFTESEDGLAHLWTPTSIVAHARHAGDGVIKHERLSVFVNPPFNSVDPWVSHAFRHLEDYPALYKSIVFLVPTRSSRPWFHKLRRHAHCPDIHFRVAYGNDEGSPAFDSSVFVLWPKLFF